MRKLLLFAIFCFSTCFFTFSQGVTYVEKDSLGVPVDTSGLITVKNSHFLSKIIGNSKSPLVLRGPAQSFVQFNHPVLGIREQVAIKTPNNFFIAISGAGRIYQQIAVTDSLLYFKRIDDNENINYNLGAFYFSVGETIYNHGGYGFWKTNGTMRGFNFKDGEWDVFPTNIEVSNPIFPSSSWFDVSKNTLYIPYQQYINSGLKGFQSAAGIIIDGVMYLDCKTWDWIQIGKVPSNYLNILKSSKIKIYNESGYFVSDGEDVYWFNFLNNSVSINSNRTLAQSIIRLDNSSIHYYKEGILYSYFPATGILDTLVIDESKFVKEPAPMWGLQFDLTTIWPLWLCLFLFIASLWYFYKVPSKKEQKRATENFGIGVKKLDVTFNQTELSLIDLFIEKSFLGATATISEINYVLGIKDKNVGMQKKVRSDVINGINDKFKYATSQDIQLILNVRSETDKRYFEYFIAKDQISEVQKLITV
ncbi:MAG: hypothetical protein ACO21X_04950 [Sediminibacterium sp.]